MLELEEGRWVFGALCLNLSLHISLPVCLRVSLPALCLGLCVCLVYESLHRKLAYMCKKTNDPGQY